MTMKRLKTNRQELMRQRILHRSPFTRLSDMTRGARRVLAAEFTIGRIEGIRFISSATASRITAELKPTPNIDKLRAYTRKLA